MDPPWLNKHVKRRKNKADGYQMLSNEDIFNKLPNISDIIDEDSLVIIWCTNSVKHLASIEKWLSQWNLTKKATWFWLKVTTSGEPVISWNHAHKKPYEPIIIASRQNAQFLEMITKNGRLYMKNVTIYALLTRIHKSRYILKTPKLINFQLIHILESNLILEFGRKQKKNPKLSGTFK